MIYLILLRLDYFNSITQPHPLNADVKEQDKNNENINIEGFNQYF